MKSPEVFCAHFAEGSPEQRVFEEQSARDWETFLLCRAKELVPGNVHTRILQSHLLYNAIIAAVASCHSEQKVKRLIH